MSVDKPSVVPFDRFGLALATLLLVLPATVQGQMSGATVYTGSSGLNYGAQNPELNSVQYGPVQNTASVVSSGVLGGSLTIPNYSGSFATSTSFGVSYGWEISNVSGSIRSDSNLYLTPSNFTFSSPGIIDVSSLSSLGAASSAVDFNFGGNYSWTLNCACFSISISQFPDDVLIYTAVGLEEPEGPVDIVIDEEWHFQPASAFSETGSKVDAVPEPSTWMLMGFGAITLLARRFRRV